MAIVLAPSAVHDGGKLAKKLAKKLQDNQGRFPLPPRSSTVADLLVDLATVGGFAADSLQLTIGGFALLGSEPLSIIRQVDQVVVHKLAHAELEDIPRPLMDRKSGFTDPRSEREREIQVLSRTLRTASQLTGRSVSKPRDTQFAESPTPALATGVRTPTPVVVSRETQQVTASKKRKQTCSNASLVAGQEPTPTRVRSQQWVSPDLDTAPSETCTPMQLRQSPATTTKRRRDVSVAASDASFDAELPVNVSETVAVKKALPIASKANDTVGELSERLAAATAELTGTNTASVAAATGTAEALPVVSSANETVTELSERLAAATAELTEVKAAAVAAATAAAGAEARVEVLARELAALSRRFHVLEGRERRPEAVRSDTTALSSVDVTGDSVPWSPCKSANHLQQGDVIRYKVLLTDVKRGKLKESPFRESVVEKVHHSAQAKVGEHASPSLLVLSRSSGAKDCVEGSQLIDLHVRRRR